MSEEEKNIEVKDEAIEQATDAELEEERQDAEAEENKEEDTSIILNIDGEENDEDEDNKAPEWVRQVRRDNKEKSRRIKELEAKLQEKEKPQTIEIGEKPTLESCDYDESALETELIAWHDRKRKADEENAKAEAEAQKQQQSWIQKVESYGQAKTEIQEKVKDYDEAESVVQDVFSEMQQAVIVKAAKNPALLVLGLGRNENRAKKLAEITDPIEFAAELARLEARDLKVNQKKAPPPPEDTVKGSGHSTSPVDSTLERLRKEAEKTGNYTKVMEYKRSKR